MEKGCAPSLALGRLNGRVVDFEEAIQQFCVVFGASFSPLLQRGQDQSPVQKSR